MKRIAAYDKYFFTSRLEIQLLTDRFEVLLFWQVWYTNVHASPQRRAKIGWTECQVSKLWVMSKCQFLFQCCQSLKRQIYQVSVIQGIWIVIWDHCSMIRATVPWYGSLYYSTDHFIVLRAMVMGNGQLNRVTDRGSLSCDTDFCTAIQSTLQSHGLGNFLVSISKNGRDDPIRTIGRDRDQYTNLIIFTLYWWHWRLPLWLYVCSRIFVITEHCTGRITSKSH